MSADRRREAARRRAQHGAFAAEAERTFAGVAFPPSTRRALVVSCGGPAIETEVGLIRALQLAGYSVSVVAGSDPLVLAYYGTAAVAHVHRWDEIVAAASVREADRVLSSAGTDLLSAAEHDTQVGRYAASTTLRALRVGKIDLGVPAIRDRFTRQVRYSLGSSRAAERLLDTAHPDLVLFNDRGYSPQAELFERAVRDGVDVLTWNAAHRNNALMLKRYHTGNRDDHPASISDRSWRAIRQIAWTPERRSTVLEEIAGCYRSGEWYSEVGTQAGTRVGDARTVRATLGFRPGVPCAAIFPHILWDGTFFWGEDLFPSYEEWLVRTVEAACANDGVDWIVKIHPANVTKNARDGVRGDPAELVAIRERIGSLPPHVRVIPADSPISTYSLYSVIDHCVTVRGTVGIEAAAHGIRTLTAGTGRFDRRGFTRDFGSADAYLDHIRTMRGDPMSPEELELAERYAYGLFLLRPLRLVSMRLEYQRDEKASVRAGFRSAGAPDRAPDVRAFIEWALDRTSEDYLADKSVLPT